MSHLAKNSALPHRTGQDHSENVYMYTQLTQASAILYKGCCFLRHMIFKKNLMLWPRI